jgi:hypothetical protein
MCLGEGRVCRYSRTRMDSPCRWDTGAAIAGAAIGLTPITKSAEPAPKRGSFPMERLKKDSAELDVHPDHGVLPTKETKHEQCI